MPTIINCNTDTKGFHSKRRKSPKEKCCIPCSTGMVICKEVENIFLCGNNHKITRFTRVTENKRTFSVVSEMDIADQTDNVT